MTARGRRALAAQLLASALACLPAAAQEEPIGPCSPFRAADGDVPSEMPGCRRRLRHAPGSLGDEIDFARGRRTGLQPERNDAEDAPPPARRRPRRRHD